MSECLGCGYDGELKVTERYIFVLKKAAISTNKLKSNGRGSSPYRGHRAAWERLLRPYTHLPKAKGKRRVFFTRFWGKRKRAYDYGNLVGGFKPLLDMLVKHDFLVDDSPRWCYDYYRQFKSPDETDYVIVVIERIEE